MSHDKGALNERPFVMITPQGLAYVGLHKDEADCWRVALGWPSDEEIAARKAEGYAVYPATLTWQKASNTSPQVPEGFALVPVEPTPEMKSAGIEVEVYNEAADRIGALTWHEVASIYRAMIDAARKGE